VGADQVRRIIHVDMDAFYAAIEQRDDPALRGRPVAVGGSARRGVVLTASYEARPYGVRSAMPVARALRLCPDLVLVRPRFEAYKAASATIRAVLARWSEAIEPLSLDEAYLDVTARCAGGVAAIDIARSVKAEIRAATGLTASAGVSFNKLLAKLASDRDKPDGLTVVRPAAALAFLAALPVEKLHGVGPATARRLHALGIRSGADLQAAAPELLARRFGRTGVWLAAIARGQDERPVQADRERRSLGVETTLDLDLVDPQAMRARLAVLAAELARRAAASGFVARSLTLKIKTTDFAVRTRQLTLDGVPPDAAPLAELAAVLLARPGPPRLPVRLLGLTLGAAPAADERQLTLGVGAGRQPGSQG
jgi:DNA polymerase-4